MIDSITYQTLLAIKPALERDRSLLDRLILCYDNTYSDRIIPELSTYDIKKNTGNTRNVYTNLNFNLYPRPDKKMHFALKIGINVADFSFNPDSPRSMMDCFKLWCDIGALDAHYPPPNGPDFLCVIYHSGYQAASLLTEDFSHGGKYEITPAPNPYGDDQKDDALNITYEGKILRKVQSDCKRDDSCLKAGEKYFRPVAVLDLLNAIDVLK